MKILYFITQADGGGAQKYVLDLAEHFKGAIAAGTEADLLFTQATQRNIKTFPLRHLKRAPHPWHDILAIFEIIRLIKQENPDIVHLNSSKAGFLGSIAGKLAGKKTVFTAHGFFYFKRAAWYIKIIYTILEWIASKFRDIIIAVSEEDRQQGISHHLLPAARIITIHNGIPIVPFLSKEEAKQKLGLSSDKIILGNIAQLYKRKAIDVLIQAVNLLPQNEQTKIQTVVIGEGPDREIFQKEIDDKKLNHIFLLPGFKPQAVTLLKAFDVFVLSSRREGFPYVLLEAMQAGLPIIATRVGGNAEALEKAGIIVDPEDPQALALAIKTVLNNSDLRQELSKKSANRSTLFSLENMFVKTEKVYKQLL